MLINIFALINLQSRVVFFFVLFYIFIHLIYKLITKKNNYIFLLVSVFAILFYPQFSNFIYEKLKYTVISIRIADTISNYSDEPRIYIYSKIFANIDQFWLTGYGLNQTTPHLFQNMTHNFPHNFLLEFWTEFGLIGLFFSFLFCFYPIILILIKKINSVSLNTIGFIYLFFFINFMKSFSIYDSNLLFLSAGLIVYNLSNRSNIKIRLFKV